MSDHITLHLSQTEDGRWQFHALSLELDGEKQSVFPGMSRDGRYELVTASTSAPGKSTSPLIHTQILGD